MKNKIIDISNYLCEDTIIYPGDELPIFKKVSQINNGDSANVGAIKIGLHHATHVDTPYHFIKDGKKLDEIPLENWVGEVLVIDALSVDKCITAQALSDINLDKYSRILFKTKNSAMYNKDKEFNRDFIYLDESVCHLLVQHNITTVGLDYLTIDSLDNKDFPAHKILLGNDVCIIESINLENVDAGEYYMVCLPLKLKDCEGANARVILMDNDFNL